MADDNVNRLMGSLGLDYSKAITSTEDFAQSIGTLNEQLIKIKNVAGTTVKEINAMFNNIQKVNKPIEITVVTDKAERAMAEFASSMGIKLDKELKKQFKGLSSGLMTGDFNQAGFDNLASGIADAYEKAAKKYNQSVQTKMFGDSDDMKIYDYLRTATIKLDDSTVSAKKNVDGFSNAIRNLAKTSKNSGLSLDQMAQELEGMGVKGFGANTEDIAEKMALAVNNVRNLRNGFTDLGGSVPRAEIDSFVKDNLTNLITSLAQIDFEAKKASETLGDEGVKTFKTADNAIEGTAKTIQDFGVTNKKVFQDAEGNAYKYIETIKDMKQKISAADTYFKDENGNFKLTGSVIDDKSSEKMYKDIEKAHAEALKINDTIDETIRKNQQLAKDSAWKQYFQGITETSDEIKELNKYYTELGGKTAKSFSEIEISQMKAKAASVEQKLYSRGLTDEYYKQAQTLREQLAVIQSRMQSEGKLTDEEMQQTMELEKQLKLLQAQSGESLADSKKIQSTGMGEEWDRRAGWFLSGTAFYGTINTAKEAVKSIKEVEMGMTEIARVTEDATFDFKGYRDELLQMGVDYGQSFANVQDIALRWAQAGYNVKDSLSLTKDALLALNTAELDASNATESMIGIMSQWNMTASELPGLIDSINRVADDYTVTSQDLVDGLLRSSSAAKIMNMDVNETIALLTVMREASGRTGAEVGNALNSIISYIQRPKSIDVMESMGINMFADKAKTQFRNVMDIFKDVEAKWDTASDEIKDGFVQSADDAGLFSEELTNALGLQEEWNDLQQRDIAQASAGVYRRNYFIGMIERLSGAEDVLNTAANAAGYSLAENGRTMDTLEKKVESLKTSATQLGVALGDSGLLEVLKALSDGATTVVEAFNHLPQPMKEFVLSALTTIGVAKLSAKALSSIGVEAKISKGVVEAFTTTWEASQATMATSTAAITSLKAALTALQTGISGVLAGLKGWAVANAPLLIISTAIAAITAFTTAYKKHREEEEQSIETSTRNIESLKQEVSQLESLHNKQAELSGQTATTVEERRKLAEVERELAELYPELTTGIDESGKAIATNTEKISELTEAKKKQLEQELLARKILAEQELPGLKKEYEEAKKTIDELSGKLKSGDTWESFSKYKPNIMPKFIKDGADAAEKYAKEVVNAGNKMNELGEKIKANEGIIASYNNISGETFAQAYTRMKSGFQGYSNLSSAVDGFANSTDAAATANQSEEETLEDVTSSLASLNQMIYDVKDGQALSADTVLDLIDKYGISIDSIHEVVDGYTIEQSALEDLREIRLRALDEQLSTDTDRVNSNSLSVSTILGNYTLEIETIEDVVRAKQELARIEAGGERFMDIMNPTRGYSYNPFENIPTKLQQAEANLDAIEAAKKRAEFRKTLLSSPSYGVKSSKSKSPSSSKSKNSSKASTAYKNEALTEELKQLDFKKSINAITTENEIAELERIKAAHVKTNDEIMDMDKRLYSARKALMDETFQNSTTWISDQKNLDMLSVDEEIAAWERVKNNQVDNVEAVKQATVNLYKLRKQQSEDAAKAEESSIKHLTTLGAYSVEEQIKAYKNLYSVRAALSADEEQSRVENLFNLYKQLLGEQQEKIKEAYDERIKMIEEEAKADKAKAQERIKDLQEELNLLDKQDAQRSYEQNIADIKKDIKYWEVRTSLDADKNEKEAREKLKEEQYKHELELQKDSINGKIDDLEDEVKDIDRLADEEKERWEKSYKLTEKAFDTHSVNIIAMAGAMSEEAYSKWEQNYLIPLQNALKSNDFSTFDSLSSGLGNSVNGLDTGRKDNKNAQIYNAANTILNLKRQWIDGNHTAADQAKQYYRTLRNLGTKGSRIADQLDAADYPTAQNIVNNLPRYHTGRLNGMEEVAVIRKDELIFPPELSRGIRALFPVISNLGKHGTSYDNRKEIKIDKLVNIENNHMEDNLDERSFARELNRTLNAII